MKKYLYLGLIILGSTSISSAQCNEVKRALKELNNSELEKAITSLDTAGALIKEQGIENIDEKCLAKYYFGRGTTNFEKAKKDGDLAMKISFFSKSEENYNNFLKLTQQPEDLLKLTQSNIYSLSVEYLNVGVDLYQKQDYAQALEYTEKGISLKRKYHPDMLDNQDLFNAMVCSKMSGQYEKGLVYVDTLLKKKNTPEKDFEYSVQKIDLLSSLNKNDEALEIIKKLKEVQPTNTNLKISELQIYMNQNKQDEALIILEDLVQTIKNREDLYVVKGQLHYAKKQVPESIKAFNDALVVNPKSESALYGLSVSYISQANDIIEAMKTPVNDNPENGQKLNGYYNLAIMNLEKVLSYNPSDKDSLNAMVSIYKSMNNTAKVNEYQLRLNTLK